MLTARRTAAASGPGGVLSGPPRRREVCLWWVPDAWRASCPRRTARCGRSGRSKCGNRRRARRAPGRGAQRPGGLEARFVRDLEAAVGRADRELRHPGAHAADHGRLVAARHPSGPRRRLYTPDGARRMRRRSRGVGVRRHGSGAARMRRTRPGCGRRVSAAPSRACAAARRRGAGRRARSRCSNRSGRRSRTCSGGAARHRSRGDRPRTLRPEAHWRAFLMPIKHAM